MRHALAFASIVAASAAACGRIAPSTDVDGGVAPSADAAEGDAAIDAPGDAAPRDGGMIDPVPDAEPEPPDLTPPSLVAVTPGDGSDAWLHAPIRFTFSEAIEASGLAVTATLDGAPVAGTATLDGPDAIVVTLDASARGVGALEVEVTGAISHSAGNPLATPLAPLSLAVPAWARPAVDRGPALGAPALAVSPAGGEVVAAWIVDDGGAQRVAVSALGAAGWRPLGELRGAASAASASIAVDAIGRALVAYVEGGHVHVERWDGAAWTALPSPGAADTAVIASAADGEVAIAVASGAEVSVAVLAADAWQPAGALAIAGARAGDVALAAGGGGRLAVGWIASVSGAPRVVVHRRASGAWTAMAPIVLGSAPPAGANTVSLALRGATLAVAYDRWDGSFGVAAALAAGDTTSTWSRLGRLLDVEATGDARAPALALDASSAPIVAWLETIEGAPRGVIARWSGGAWRVVGGPTWLPAGAAAARAGLALHTGDAPVVAYRAGLAARFAAHNGPRVAKLGLAARPPLAGCAFSAAAPPARLSLTGCFTIAGGAATPHAGLVPYDIVAELWSDGTRKRRWLALPAGGSLAATSNGSLSAPDGTFVVKEFAHGGRVIETRFLVRESGAWSGFTYRWRADGSDADLLGDFSTTATWGGYTHVYPSRTQCRSCHHTSHGPLLGLRGEQLARWFDYGGVIAEQLPTLAAIGVTPAMNPPAIASPHDPHEPVERRARAYLHANCAHCHNGSYITVRDMRFATPLAQARLCDVIAPGLPQTSRLHQQVTQRPGMPPLGTLVVDPLAGELTGAWISSMTSCP